MHVTYQSMFSRVILMAVTFVAAMAEKALCTRSHCRHVRNKCHSLRECASSSDRKRVGSHEGLLCERALALTPRIPTQCIATICVVFCVRCENGTVLKGGYGSKVSIMWLRFVVEVSSLYDL
jgi:hypothetical protein